MFEMLTENRFRTRLVNKNRALTALLVFTMAIIVSAHTTLAQTTTFTFQGRLADAGAPASGAHDLEFKLYDAAGAQVGATLTREDVVVTDGVFVVELDFGLSPFASTTASTLEIGVRPGASTGAFTALVPRQAITSTPYAIKTLSAAQLGGVAADQYVKTDDARMSDARQPASGSSNYIQNQTAAAQPAGFNISGDGTASGILSAGVVNAATQFNIGGNRVLSAMGTNNVFTGVGAGQANLQGKDNAFFGFNAGLNNTGNALGIAGNFNSFFGSGAGRDNTVGSNNSFFGFQSGSLNKSNSNSFFGSGAGSGATTGRDNSFFGVAAGAGVNDFGAPPAFNTGSNNSFFGSNSGLKNKSGSENTFFGYSAGSSNTSGNANTFIGALAGSGNTSGSNNTFIGNNARPANGSLTNATAIGVNAIVQANNTIVLGTISETVDVPGLMRIGRIPALPNFFTPVCQSVGSGLLVRCFISSLRYKTDVQSLRAGLEVVNRLRPVTFRWKGDGMPDFGLIAEEVAEVEPLLAIQNEQGVIEGVKYNHLSVVLVNAVKEQQAQIKRQQKQIDELKKLVCIAYPAAEVCKQ